MSLNSSFHLANMVFEVASQHQYVQISGNKSQFFIVSSDVLQRSQLGPLFFILFINDDADIFHRSRCFLFADDLKNFKPITTILDVSNLQSDLDTLLSWCEVNNLNKNINKCKCMSLIVSKSH